MAVAAAAAAMAAWRADKIEFCSSRPGEPEVEAAAAAAAAASDWNDFSCWL